ncbi:oxygenase MpaB family protein [Accumulibacter sp.]|uniref:oxygenase MpaB family protein n=1 Tax=Accumulibacter sp. TaxID=2053492 RepID=UPI002630789E|nr:oxygenase MpaB family protein [Accumulibacter sp.]
MPFPTDDPRRDCQQIARHLARVDFPWDTTRALELALFRTFASPRIGGLLHATGEFAARPQKRYDDTDLLVSEIIEEGFDSPRGCRAIARMNALHGRFRIANGDFLYVLSTFVFEPIRWNERFGWRRMSESEKFAWFWFWRQVGERMQIRDIPEAYDEFERYGRDYEAANFRYTDSNQRVALATRELFAGWFPALLRPLVRRGIHALLDPSLLAAFDLRPAPRWMVWTANAALRARARLLRCLPRRRRVQRRTQRPRADYPAGYRIESLGPPPVD